MRRLIIDGETVWLLASASGCRCSRGRVKREPRCVLISFNTTTRTAARPLDHTDRTNT